MKMLKTILRRFKRLFSPWVYKLSPYTNNEQITAFLCQITLLLLVLLFSLGFISCSTVKYVPIDTNSQVIVRDSIIRVVDTVRVEVPKEVIREIVPQDTVSVLRTSLAESTAKVENGKLNHELRQQGTVKVKIDTCYVTKIEEKITYQEVPVEVIKEVKHIPNWVTYSLIFNIGVILLFGLRIFLKIKKVI